MVERRYYNRQLETMSRKDFLKMQWQELQKQIRYTYKRSGLCKRKFKEAKITPDDIKTREDFTNKVPFTTKQDLLIDQQETPPYGTRLAVPEDQIFVTFLTSGTSGKGQEVHCATKEDVDILADATAMMFVWYGWRKGDKVMFSLPIGMTISGVQVSEATQGLGCQIFNLGIYDTKTKLEYMKRFKIAHMHIVPAYLEALTAEAEGLGLNPARQLRLSHRNAARENRVRIPARRSLRPLSIRIRPCRVPGKVCRAAIHPTCRHPVR